MYIAQTKLLHIFYYNSNYRYLYQHLLLHFVYNLLYKISFLYCFLNMQFFLPKNHAES